MKHLPKAAPVCGRAGSHQSAWLWVGTVDPWPEKKARVRFQRMNSRLMHLNIYSEGRGCDGRFYLWQGSDMIKFAI